MPLNGFRQEYENCSIVERDEMVVKQFSNVEIKTIYFVIKVKEYVHH